MCLSEATFCNLATCAEKDIPRSDDVTQQKLRWCFVAPVYDTGGGNLFICQGTGIHFTFQANTFAILPKTFCNFDKYICPAVYDTQSRGQQKLFICQTQSGRGGGSRGEEVEAPLIQITFIITLPYNSLTFLHSAFTKVQIKFIIALLQEPYNGLHYI